MTLTSCWPLQNKKPFRLRVPQSPEMVEKAAAVVAAMVWAPLVEMAATAT